MLLDGSLRAGLQVFVFLSQNDFFEDTTEDGHVDDPSLYSSLYDSEARAWRVTSYSLKSEAQPQLKPVIVNI